MYVTRSQERPNAKQRLFCFPHAGGTSNIFRPWNPLLPPEIELCAIDYPGRVHLKNQPAKDMDELIDAIFPEIVELLDKPFDFYGHSFGTYVAYGCIMRLLEEGKNLPRHFIVSSHRPPHIKLQEEFSYNLSDEEFIDVMGNQYHAIPEVVLKEKDLLNMFLPILRADIRINEVYYRNNDKLINIPISLLYGKQDVAEPIDILEKWKEVTSSSFDVYPFEGGHFFIDSARKAVVDTIVKIIT